MFSLVDEPALILDGGDSAVLQLLEHAPTSRRFAISRGIPLIPFTRNAGADRSLATQD